MTSNIDPKPNTTIAYTDGACKGNPGAGGWGAWLILDDGSTKEYYGGESNTTNNRMEMMATIVAITQATIVNPTHNVELWTDSSYVKNGITGWIEGWKKKGWKTSGNKPVKNQDLWQKLDQLNQAHSIDWHWIKGHAGHEGNEKADELANLGVLQPEGNVQSLNVTSTSMTKTSTTNLKKNLTKSDNQTNQPSDDWMTNDILGFDSFDDDYNDEDEGSDNLYVPQITVSSDTDNVKNFMTSNAEKKEKEGETEMDSQMLHQVSDITNNQLPEFDGDTSRANPNFRPLLPHPVNQGRNHRQLIMDTETTGFEYNNGDRIIEVGIVELVGRKFTGEKLHVYINPDRQEPMSEEVIRVHGITDVFLADKPTFNLVAQQIYDFMAGAEIIAHNATFDMNFLDMEFTKVGLPRLSDNAKVTDTLAIAKNQYPGQRNTLDALVKRLNVGKQDRTFHGALLDSEILAEVFLAMTGGQVSLAIDDDSISGGEIKHTHFAELSQQLIAATTHNDDHQQWLEKISQKFPAVNEVWKHS